MEIPFIGQSYVSRSRTVDCEQSINLYPEIVEETNAKAKMILVGVPGRKKWVDLPAGGIRGMWTVPGTPDRLFVVSGMYLYEVTRYQVYTQIGTLITHGGPVGMDNNPTQLIITDGARIYIYALSTGVFTSVDGSGNSNQGNPNAPIYGATCAFIDSYFVTHKTNTNRWGLSDILDGKSWDDLDQAAKEGSPDNIVALVTAHRELFLMGQYTSEIWYDTGNATFPFSPVQGVFLEQGLAAPFSLRAMDNTIVWIGYDKKGWGVVYKLNGYVPERISTHAIEKLLNTSGELHAAVCYCYQEEGHSFYAINAPNMNTTLVYDASTTFWHERKATDDRGIFGADRVGYHSFCWGIHIFGDKQLGRLYTSSLDWYDDDGLPLRRIRITPHYHSDLRYTFYNAFQVDMEVGVGQAAGGETLVNPKAMLKYSNDGGNSWSSERWTSIGKIGERKSRARWTQLGRARDRVFYFEVSDPVKVVLIGADLDATAGGA